MHRILVKKQSGIFKERISLASSKSESNRALIINALASFSGSLENLSSARDTQTMIRLLASSDPIADVLDAGTTMRFLTAYFTVTNQNKTMTGTPRMCERPIGILVDALQTLGAEIEYQNKVGYPPINIKGLKKQLINEIAIKGDVSSQYISALLMIAPMLENGLVINLTGEIGSIPYIKMTIRQMEAFGVEVDEDWEIKRLSIKNKKYQSVNYQIESDWSGASYWYSMVAMAENPDVEIELLGLKKNSLQGDSVIVDIMARLGVESTFTNNGVLLKKIPEKKNLEWDFTNCPDLAQTVAVVLVAKNIPGVFTGVESLKIKETDRIKALQNELAKIGGDLVEVKTNARYEVNVTGAWTETPTIHTYDDHRMAMAFAPLGMLKDVIIEDPGVVAKSYPSYWEDLAKIVVLEEIN
jgi:3-phosphoshikimate 1-carboxyvinyltransferase